MHLLGLEVAGVEWSDLVEVDSERAVSRAVTLGDGRVVARAVSPFRFSLRPPQFSLCCSHVPVAVVDKDALSQLTLGSGAFRCAASGKYGLAAKPTRWTLGDVRVIKEGLWPGDHAGPQPLEQDFGNHSRALSSSMSLLTMVQQKAQRRDTLAATWAQKDAAKALREQKKQKEAAKLAELESQVVLCETVYACGVAPREIAKAKRCPTCCTIAESGRACGKGPGREQMYIYDSMDRSGSREAIDSRYALRTQPSKYHDKATYQLLNNVRKNNRRRAATRAGSSHVNILRVAGVVDLFRDQLPGIII
ncbi:hypothetical protein T492DRAFT_1148784 [Pavlovales sp. CCMP2436]|nr:hypothetical protein T492DRAFT_1148784 [Pavlovales sp. CCMP2436]